MFKMDNIGTPKVSNLCLELELGLYGKNKLPLIAPVYLLKSSITHLLGLPSITQSDIHSVDDECTVQKVIVWLLLFAHVLVVTDELILIKKLGSVT